MTGAGGKPLLETVRGRRQQRAPIWIMRQAGRYLPEYREIRSRVDGFLDLCYRPDLAAEVTLQPLRRFDLDGAILFSDILVIPDALGQGVRFEAGEGPVLDPLDATSIAALRPERVLEHLAPVLETLSRVKAELSPTKTMIGFCGSPWTVATYMIGGRGSPDQAAARLFALAEPEAFAALIDVLIEASVDYLAAQFAAGADVVQLFESWAGNLDEAAFRQRVIAPNRRIVEGLRKRVPDAPIIGFPRAAAGMLGAFVSETGVDAVGLDHATPPAFADSVVPRHVAVQGNLDPLRLVAGGRQMEECAHDILGAFANRAHIFNLGHGIVPETPIAHVERLIEIVRNG